MKIKYDKNQIEEVIIEITEKCNLKCIHCGSDCNGKPIASKSELTLDEWKDCLNQLKGMNVQKVVFSGGEATLKDGFEEIISFAHQIGLNYGFITNGLVFSNSLIGTIEKCKPFSIGISIDGLKEVHNIIRGNKKSWRQINRVISKICKLNIPVCAITTINKMNYEELPRLAKFLNDSGVLSWQLQTAMPYGRMGLKSDLLVDEELFKKLCLVIMLLRSKYPNMYIVGADCFGMAPAGTVRPLSWPGCAAGLSAAAIDAFGNVMPCLSMQSGPNKCGNLREKSLKEIWQKSSGFDFNRKFKRSDIGENCHGCKLVDRCRGGCSAQSFAHSGKFHNGHFCFARSFGLTQ